MREAQGPGQRAWHHGGLWIVNELHRGSADCHERIINALDDPSIATDTTALGTILRPRAEFGCIATQNAGSLVLSDALRDRFAMRIAVLRPSAGQLARLDHDVRVWVERAYAALPQSEWEIGPRPSYRDCLSFCQSRAAGIDDETAALAIMGEDTGDELRAWLESLQMIKGESARNRASGDTDTVVVVGVDDHTLTCPDCGQTGTGSDPGNCDIAQRTDFKRGGVAHLKCSACLAEWHEWADGGQDIQKRGTRPR
jgi:hypothetical protein